MNPEQDLSLRQKLYAIFG